MFDIEWLIVGPYFLGPLAFAIFMGAGVAEAQSFRYTYRVAAVSVVLIIGLLWLLVISGLFSASA